MSNDWVLNYSDMTLTMIGFFLFAIVFFGSIWFTYHKERKHFFSKMETLPIEGKGGLHE